MGGTPLIELYVMYAEVASILAKSGVTVARSLVGPYMTSLEMAGCSVTLLKVDDDLLRLWDAPVRTPGLRRGGGRCRRSWKPRPCPPGSGSSPAPSRTSANT